MEYKSTFLLAHLVLDTTKVEWVSHQIWHEESQYQEADIISLLSIRKNPVNHNKITAWI